MLVKAIDRWLKDNIIEDYQGYFESKSETSNYQRYQQNAENITSYAYLLFVQNSITQNNDRAGNTTETSSVGKVVMDSNKWSQDDSAPFFLIY